MQRRDFLRLAGLAGLTVATPLTLSRRARAADPYDGPFFVMLNAAGGWDPTSLCDPKGTLDSEIDVADANPMNRSYLARDIRQAGNIRYAPVGGNQAFFDKYAERLLVVNGLDTSTNGHDSGSRHTWSGRLAEGFPAFAALVAASKAKGQPLAFITNGGFDLTEGLVAPTRSGGTQALTRLAFPNRSDPNNENSRMHSDAAFDAIQAAQSARLERQLGRRNAPRLTKAMSTLFTARLGQSDIARLNDFLPGNLDNSGNPLIRQAQVALAAYRAGLAASVNLNIGGFDTHGNHDQQHIPQLQRVLEGADFVMSEAERGGIGDKIVLVIGSDFGRTPGYNAGNGKDHWSITSMMLMGAGIRGNRVLGRTDERHRQLKVAQSDLSTQDDGGLALNPGHVHQALRTLAGIDEGLLQEFPLLVEQLDLL